MATPNPFPLNIADKINSPALEAFFLQFGDTKYIGAQNLNKMLQALEYLYENIGGGSGAGADGDSVQVYDPSIEDNETLNNALLHFWAVMNELMAVPQPVNPDWNATFGLAKILNKPLAQNNKAAIITINSSTLGSLSAANLKNYINALNPALVVSADQFPIFIIEDIARFFFFRRGAGTYGFGATQTVASDYYLVPAFDYAIPSFDQVIHAGGWTSLPVTFSDPVGTYPQGYIDKNYFILENWNGGNFEGLRHIYNKLVFAKTYYPGAITFTTQVTFEDPTVNGTFTIPSGSGTAATREYVNGLLTALKDGVPTAGNTLQKLYNIILGVMAEDVVNDLAARAAYNIPHLPFSLFVLDDGDGTWAKYQAISTGVGANYVKTSDPDMLNAAMSASAIKASYESNSNTNAFTNTYKNRLDALTSTSGLSEGTNLYFTVARALGTILSTLSTAVGGPVLPTDTLIQGIGKLQYQITNLSAIYQTLLDDNVLGGLINSFAAKSTPADADYDGIVNAADGKMKKITWAQRKAAFKAYFDQFLDVKENFFVRDTVNTSTVTGVTALTAITSKLIPANTLAAGSQIVMEALLHKYAAGAVAGGTYYFYTNTANNLTGAVKLATFNVTATGYFTNFKRKIVFRPSSKILIYSPTTSAVNDDITQSQEPVLLDFNVSQDNYIFVAVTPTNSADSFSCESIVIKGIK